MTARGDSWICADCRKVFASLQDLKKHAQQGTQTRRAGRPFAATAEAEGQLYSGLYSRGNRAAVEDGEMLVPVMDVDQEDAVEAQPEEPGFAEEKRLLFAHRAASVELTFVEYTIARAVLKLPAMFATDVVQIIYFLRYGVLCTVQLV